MPVHSLKGSRTAVFGASMTDDYQKQVSKDPETMPRMNLAGNAFAILPNRLSWYFDLLGPSVHVDTACSSSLVALDLACQSIRSGDADTVSNLYATFISFHTYSPAPERPSSQAPTSSSAQSAPSSSPTLTSSLQTASVIVSMAEPTGMPAVRVSSPCSSSPWRRL